MRRTKAMTSPLPRPCCSVFAFHYSRQLLDAKTFRKLQPIRYLQNYRRNAQIEHLFFRCVPFAIRIVVPMRHGTLPFGFLASAKVSPARFRSSLYSSCILSNPAFSKCSCGTHFRRLRFLAHFLSLCCDWSSGVLESCLQARETYTPRPGSNVRSRCNSPPSARRCQNRWPRYGSMPFRQGNSVASRYWRRWETSHSRALRFPAKKIARIRRRSNDRTPRQYETPRMVRPTIKEITEEAFA